VSRGRAAGTVLVVALLLGGVTPSAATSTGASGGGAWPTAGADLRNTRAAPGSRITSETVDTVRERWRTPLEGFGSLSTVPIVVDDTVYLAGGTGRVAAIDVATGAIRWTSESSGFNIGPYGVAVDDDRIYAVDGSDGVVALDRRDGARLWATDVTATPSTGIDIQPVIVDDLVIVSSVPISVGGIYSPGDQGVVTALEAETGAVRWTFDTVKGDDLWGHPEVNSGGGAWYPPAVDERRGLVYVGVANPAPFPGTPEYPNGSSRPGDNLYTDSLVALDLETGTLEWFHQVTAHDLFDRDQVHAMIADVRGKDVVVSAGKSGVVVGLGPRAGTVRWETAIGRHDNDDLTALDGPTVVYPGTYGGVLTPPATADGVVYAAVVNAPATLEPDETAYFGADLGTADGEVVAIDARTGRIRWATPVPGDPLGGATVVGDLVMTALLDGTVLALDRRTGEIVRSWAAGGGINGWMAALDDVVLVPVGTSHPPALVALGLPQG
jgi:outer membrane protein assembly factor BamB